MSRCGHGRRGMWRCPSTSTRPGSTASQPSARRLARHVAWRTLSVSIRAGPTRPTATAPGPEVEELGAADVPRVHHLDPLEPGGGERERPLDTDAVGDAPDGEAGPRALAAPPDDHALEDLDALLLALDDPHVHAHGVTG